ncbi:MAG: hypothetical protein KGZ81_04350 [Flavobacteriales bacterium]|nr:hypothetical protein [Flavobacteriales bacterium]
MNSIKRILLITFSLVLLLANVAYANDLKEMTLEEKAEWAINNVKPEYYDGIKEESEEGGIGTQSAPSGWIVTQVHSNYITSPVQLLGALETQARWTCDDFLNVVDYEVLKFQEYKYVQFGSMHKYSSINRLTPSNVMMVFQLDFVDFSGGHSLIQQYNLHGHGVYSFRVY